MRVTNMLPDAQHAMQQSQQALNVALQQVSTLKRVNQLSDDPAASASMVRSLAASQNVDQYTANVTSILSQTQTADSALSSVVTLLNEAVTLGTGGANGTLTTSNRQGYAAQVQGVLSDVVSRANISYQGSYLFGGAASTTAPFTVDSTNPNGYKYNGNSTVNSVQVGDAMSVQTNLPGDQVFTSGANVIGSLNSLVTALQTGTAAQINDATVAVTTALNYIGQQRVILGSSTSQLNAQESYLGQEKLSLTTQQTALVGIGLDVAATNLSQATLAHSAVLAAAAKSLPMTLLDYLK